MSNTESQNVSSTDVVPVLFKSSGSRKPRQGKRFGKGERRAPTSAAIPALPSALSTTASITRDDPFLVDEFEVEGMSLQPNNLRPEFAVTHAGYMDLVTVSHELLCHTERHFAARVPFSIYAYYCGQLLHARLNELDKLHHRTYSADFDQLVLSC